MNPSFTAGGIDWSPVLNSIRRREAQHLPSYCGDLKTALLNHAGLLNHPQGEKAFQLAREIARLTTYCDLEIVYWFSRLISSIDNCEEESL